MLDRLELSALAERYPFQLSGGQQQRVAIARSLVYHPRLLLLDEPLSNLDAQLRERARSWLRIVHDSFKLTTILVTHDQVEALSLSDQVVLLNKGSIAQSGSPSEIYERPRSAYAAEFVGNANIIQGKATKVDGDKKQAWIETTTGIRIAAHSHAPIIPGAEACVAIRPQRVRLLAEPGGRDNEGAVLQFEAKSVLYQGSNFEIIGRTPAGDLRILSDFAPQAEHRHVLLPSKDCLCVLP
jgi:iron(III) transport system ATP-binding protein